MTKSEFKSRIEFIGPHWIPLAETNLLRDGTLMTTYRRMAAHLWLDFSLSTGARVWATCSQERCCNPEHLCIRLFGEGVPPAVKPRQNRNYMATADATLGFEPGPEMPPHWPTECEHLPLHLPHLPPKVAYCGACNSLLYWTTEGWSPTKPEESRS